MRNCKACSSRLRIIQKGGVEVCKHCRAPIPEIYIKLAVDPTGGSG